MASIAKNAWNAHYGEYGEAPKFIISTPGRFHILGEHSWFFKDKTLSMAVNLPVMISVSLRDDNQFRFYFVQAGERKKVNISNLKFKKEDRWANALKAMIYGWTSGGFDIKGLNITVYTDILPSAGFGITTAMKVGTAMALKKMFRPNLSDAELLQVIERGNKLFLHTKNYLADNFAALYSKPDTLIVTDYSRQTYDNIPFNFEGRRVLLTDARVPRISIWDEESIREPENALLLGDLKEKKTNAYGGWHYESSPTEINEILSVVSESDRRKLLYIIKEHQNVLDAIDALEKNNFSHFARAINYSHKILRELYELSCPEIDWILKRVNELEPNLDDIREPVNCGRITGKGFGRSLFSIVREKDVDEYYNKLSDYERIFGFTPQTFEVKPAKGSCVVKP